MLLHQVSAWVKSSDYFFPADLWGTSLGAGPGMCWLMLNCWLNYFPFISRNCYKGLDSEPLSSAGVNCCWVPVSFLMLHLFFFSPSWSQLKETILSVRIGWLGNGWLGNASRCHDTFKEKWCFLHWEKCSQFVGLRADSTAFTPFWNKWPWLLHMST